MISKVSFESVNTFLFNKLLLCKQDARTCKLIMCDRYSPNDVRYFIVSILFHRSRTHNTQESYELSNVHLFSAPLKRRPQSSIYNWTSSGTTKGLITPWNRDIYDFAYSKYFRNRFSVISTTDLNGLSQTPKKPRHFLVGWGSLSQPDLHQASRAVCNGRRMRCRVTSNIPMCVAFGVRACVRTALYSRKNRNGSELIVGKHCSMRTGTGEPRWKIMCWGGGGVGILPISVIQLAKLLQVN